MHKVIRATERAKTQAKRKLAAVQTHNRIVNRQLRIEEQKQINVEVRSRLMAARTARREDWLMGPLAPRRDVGKDQDIYGTVSAKQIRGVAKEKSERKDWCIRAGDRVVIVAAKHRDAGKIGIVKDLMEESEECTIEGLNLVDVATPRYVLEATGENRTVQTTEASIQLCHVRLVYPLLNRETGIRRDVIINELEKRSVPETPGRFSYKRRVDQRYIAGLEPREYIPFPALPKPELTDHDQDTLRIEVDERTWIPTLLGPPMPETVIDELRNKYGVFRDRHDDEFIQKKEEGQASLAAWKKKKAEMMVTPLQQFHRKQRDEKRKLGWAPLDQETMKRIGQVMARNGAKVLPSSQPRASSK